MTVEDLRYSPNRFREQKKGKKAGWFFVRYWMAYAGKKTYVSPVSLYADMPWQKGIEHCAEHGGEAPDITWLDSLVDYRSDNFGLVPGARAIGFKTGWHWSRREVAGNPDYARVVALGSGSVSSCCKVYSSYVRPVRLSQ